MTEISDHARKRIKLRADGDPEKMLADAIANGHRAADFTGKFGRYLHGRQKEYRSTAIVHKGKIFFIKQDVLTTMYPIPHDFRKYKPKGAKA